MSHPGGIILRTDDQVLISSPSCDVVEQMERPFPFNSLCALLDWCFRISEKSDLHSANLTFENAGSGGESIFDERLSSALVQAAIKRELGWDYLISCVEGIHGESPESLKELVDQLAMSTGVSLGRVLSEVEAFRIFRKPDPHRRENRVTRKLSGWYEMATDILQKEFSARGWVRDIDMPTRKV